MIKTQFDPFPTIATDRLVLRAIGMDDINEIFFLRADKEVMRYTGQPVAVSTSEIRAYIQQHLDKVAEGKGIIWGITLKDDPTLIGLIAFRKFQPEHFRGEIGYGLHPAHQNKRIMQEAIEAVIDYGFNEIWLHTIEANVDKDNAASIRLLERNNFVKEAHYKENYFFEGKFIDSVIYSLIDHSKLPGFYATV